MLHSVIVGMIKGKIVKKSMIRSGISTLIIGGIAAICCLYLVGYGLNFSSVIRITYMSELTRHMGLFHLTMYGVGLILGAGIYVLIGEAAGFAGNSMWISFLLGAVVAIFAGIILC